MNHCTRLIVLCGTLGLGLTACSTDKSLNIGETTVSGVSGLSDYADHWDGYAEAFRLGYGDGGMASDRIRIILDATGQGTFEFGDDPIAPPATDPNAGYPVGTISTASLRSALLYPLRNTRIESNRLRFGIGVTDPYKDWCALQTPVLRTGSSDDYYCTNGGRPTSDGGCVEPDPVTGELRPLDCGKLSLCQGTPPACRCTATVCYPTPFNDTVQIDAALENSGTTMVGTLMINSERVTIRLTRR